MQAIMLAFQESQVRDAASQAQVAMMLARMEKSTSEQNARIEVSETATQDAINDVRNSIAMMTPAEAMLKRISEITDDLACYLNPKSCPTVQ